MENILLLANFIIVLCLNAAWIIGFYNATRYEEHAVQSVEDETKMILWRIRFYSLKWFGKFWSKPICECPPCMASLHSVWYFLFFDVTLLNIGLYVFYIGILSGLLRLILSKFDI